MVLADPTRPEWERLKGSLSDVEVVSDHAPPGEHQLPVEQEECQVPDICGLRRDVVPTFVLGNERPGRVIARRFCQRESKPVCRRSA